VNSQIETKKVVLKNHSVNIMNKKIRASKIY